MRDTYSTIEKLERRHPFCNLKILLAEDNEVNQLLAKSILRFWGLEAKIAVTGFEVLTLLKNEEFDIILMDIQMPEKSGIEAAEEIRKLKDPKKRNIPIIALTANALKGEENKYRAVGMDDFLTKPFKEADLYEVIEKVLRKEGAFGRETKHNTFEMENNYKQTVTKKLYDFEQLEEIAAGDPDFLVALAQIYLDTIPDNSVEMVEAAKSGDWVLVSKLAHKLKSTIDSMNISSISKDVRTLEFDGKNKVNTNAIGKLTENVNAVIQLVAEQLREDFAL